jgi:excisionase family DNA binding protein
MNFLTVEEFSERIKLHPATIRKAIKEGKIFASRPSMGKRAPFRIAESELERLHLQSMCEKDKK